MLYMMLADGFEETEMIAPLDILRRAGIAVQTVGVTGREVAGAHGVIVTADVLPEETKKEDCDGVILPGGMPGTTNLFASEFVKEMILDCNQKGGLLGAICAAPMIFGEMGLLNGLTATCFPGFEEHLKGAFITKDPVAIADRVITSRGAGTALLFGAALVNDCKGEGEGEKILSQMQYV